MPIPRQGRESKSALIRFIPCGSRFRKGGNAHSFKSGKLKEPCRISVFTEGDRVGLTTLKSTALFIHFYASELKPTAEDEEEASTKIMREALA